jgi:putative cell wall-binding protein
MSTRRLGGADRFATAVAVAKASYPSGAAAAVLASGSGFADALSGAYLAGVLDAPTLLTQSGSLPTATAKALADLGVHTVYVVGGPVAVADSVVDQLHKAGYEVVRIAGADRYGTAGKVAASDSAGIGRVGGLRTALLATGTAFPDALAGGPLSYAAGLPLLLTRPDTLPAPTITALRELGVQQVLVLGGPKAVTPGVASQLEQLGVTVRRLEGADRAETAVAVARYAMSSLGFTNRHVHLARGDAYPDALVAGPHAGKEQAVILLTLTPTRNAPATLSFLHGQAAVVSSADVLGGTAAVSETVVTEAQAQTAH